MSSALTAHKKQPLQACLHAAAFLCAAGHSGNDKIMHPTTKRIAWIDAAKGFAIFFIVCGHCADKNGADRILLHFSMFTGVAVFFLLSGMTFCWKENSFLYFDRRPFRDFLRGLLRGVIAPYICWSLISIAVYRAFGAAAVHALGSDRSHFSLAGNLAGMLYGNSGSGYMEWNRPLWFLTCLAVTELFWYAVFWHLTRTGKNSFYAYAEIAFICAASAGWFLYTNLHSIQLCLPWETETAVCVLPFFGLGRFLRGWMEGSEKLHLNKSKAARGAVLMVCTVLLWSLLWGVKDADFRADRFTQPWRFYPESILGIAIVLTLAGAAASKPDAWPGRLLMYAGQRTMAILVMHKFAIMAGKVLLAGLGFDLADLLDRHGANTALQIAGLTAFDAAAALCVVMLCLLAERLLVRLVPFVFGKSVRR